MKALFEAMNVAYNEEEKRGFVRLTLMTLGFTLAALVAILLLVGVGVVLPIVLQLVGVGTGAQWAARIGGIAVAFLLMVGGLAALYRWGPSRASAKWRWITPGAMVAIVVIAVASLLFTWYVASFGSYNATYGSLGALFGLMTWLWICTIIVIAGAELNSETEHQTARDTTTGPPRPMGRRGAFMADTIGEPYGEATPDRSGPASADAPRDREPPLLTRVAILRVSYGSPAVPAAATPVESSRSPSGGRLRQRLVEVGDEVARVLDADREAHEVGRRPGRALLLLA